MPTRPCLACERVLPLDLFRKGRGVYRFCDDCRDTARITDELRRLSHNTSTREHKRRVRYPWYSATA